MGFLRPFLLTSFDGMRQVPSRAELLPPASAYASGALLVLRALRMKRPSIRLCETGSSGGGGGGEGAWIPGGGDTWLDKIIVSEALALLSALAGKPRAPASLRVSDLCSSRAAEAVRGRGQEGERERAGRGHDDSAASATLIGSGTWPVAGLFLSACLLHDTLRAEQSGPATGACGDSGEGVSVVEGGVVVARGEEGRGGAAEGRVLVTQSDADEEEVQEQVALACEVLTMSASCASSEHEAGASAALDAAPADAAPWATFALNVARQYAAAHPSSAACSALTRTALHLCQYSTHRDIYRLGKALDAPPHPPTSTGSARQVVPASAYGARAGDICEHHRERGRCVDCRRQLAAAESAAEKSLRLLKKPLAKSLATLSDFYAPEAAGEEEEEEKQRRYRLQRTGGRLEEEETLQAPEAAAPAAGYRSVAPDDGSPAAAGEEGAGGSAAAAAAAAAAVSAPAPGWQDMGPQDRLLASVDWSAPAISGHLAHATLQMSAFERLVLLLSPLSNPPHCNTHPPTLFVSLCL